MLLELHNCMGLTTRVLAKHGDLQAHSSRALVRIAALLAEGKHTGELDHPVPRPIMLAMFVTLISPTGYEQLLTSGQVSPTELVNYIRRIFFPPVADPAAKDSLSPAGR